MSNLGESGSRRTSRFRFLFTYFNFSCILILHLSFSFESITYMHGKKNSNSTKQSLESKTPFKNKILSEKGKKPNEA